MASAIGRKRSGKRKKTARRRVVVIGKPRRKSRRVGSTSVGKTRKRRRVGATGGSLKAIGTMAIGIAGGALATHMVLRPLEQHVTDHYPMAGKFMGAAEILIGGYVGIHAKNALVRGAGFGVMAGGVHTVMHQFNIGKHSPALKGMDYATTNIPISGGMESTMNGMIRRDGGPTRSSLVAGLGGRLNGTSFGSVGNLYKTHLLAGIEDETNDYLPPKY
jgi:hypothetical protein